MIIQSFIQLTGTLVVLFVLSWRLSLIVAVCYVVMFWYIRFSGKRSKKYYLIQQESLGDLDGYIEEMVNGQKVVKVFNHEQKNLEEFRRKNKALQEAGTGAQSYAASMIPAVVTISYIKLCEFVGRAGRNYGHERDHGCGNPWPAIWCLSVRRPCRLTSSRSRATLCWLPWPERSGFSV